MNAMTSALQDYRNIWRVTTVQRAEGSVKLVRRLALFVLFIGAIVVATALWRHKMDGWIFARVLVGTAASWVGLLWAVLFVPGSMLLNSVINARLLPRQRRRLMQMTGGGWLLLTLAFTMVAGSWTALPLMGIYIFSFALMFGAWNAQGAVPMILIGNWSWLSRRVLPPALVDALASDAVMAVLAVLLVPAVAWALRWMCPAGGDAHFDRRNAHIKRMARFEGRGGASQLESGCHTLRTYAAALRRDCSGKQRADPGRMLMHVLGPAMHWSAWTGTVAVMLAMGIGIRLLLAWQGGESGNQSIHDFVEGASMSGLGMLVLTILFSTAQLRQSMTRTRGEQSLLRLAPLTGNTALLNRRLATQLLRRALGLWIVLTVTILAVSALVAGPEVLARQFGLCCLAGQIAMMGLLGDHAGNGGWHIGLAWRAAGLALLEALAALALGGLTRTPVWLWMAAIALGVAAFQLRRSWGVMLAAPVAFPARRLA